jgi:ABC-type uncharacterized transport system substrate-binding protein
VTTSYSLRRTALATALALTGVSAITAPVAAHPHVYVTNAATVVFEKGVIVAIDHVWAFDEFYSAMAVEGLDTNKDGKYSREELAELAKTNIEGLKDFDYFTQASLAGRDLKLAEPKNYWLEYNNNLLELHFRSPLLQPVPTDVKDLAFSVGDPSFFISFDLVKDNPIKLGEGAPKGCAFKVGAPKPEADPQASQAKRLSESFFEQLGGGNSGIGMAKTVTVSCNGK